MVGGVYAGPTVTVTYSKETDDVDFSETNQTVTSDNHSNADIDKTQSERSADPSNETSMHNDGGGQQVELVLSVDAATNHVDIKRTVTTETLEDTTAGEKEDNVESNEIKHTQAPLASEEDLTAPDVSVTSNKQSLLS